VGRLLSDRVVTFYDMNPGLDTGSRTADVAGNAIAIAPIYVAQLVPSHQILRISTSAGYQLVQAPPISRLKVMTMLVAMTTKSG
jgi:hypothetical protein